MLAVLGEYVLTRAYTRSRPRSFDFLLSQVSQRMESKILHHPKNDVSFYLKPRVVLWKVTCRFVENNVLFWIGGRKVVLRMVFWGVFGVE